MTFSPHRLNRDLDDTCPECSQSWRGMPVPDSYITSYCDGVQYYSLLMGVEIRGVYDGVCFWQCPHCEARFHRFPEGDTLRAKVEYIVSQW